MTLRHHPPVRRIRSVALATTVAVLAVACGGSSDDTTPATAVTVRPAGTDDAPAESSPETAQAETEPAATEPPSTGDEVESDPPAESAPAAAGDPDEESGDSSDGSDEGDDLGAAPGADLPTAAPGDEAPPTTAPGPLPIPRISFVCEGEYVTPVELAVRPLDPRLYVVEQRGRIVAADAESSAVVLDIDDVDTTFTSGGEQGLLGLAFHPSDDLAYVDFTAGDGSTVVAEFAVDPATGAFDVASYRELFRVGQPFPNHNGGGIEFGPDGMLYVALGDGGSANDPERASRDLSRALGSILRIEPTGGDGTLPYGVPDDNPFVGVDGVDDRIWAYGLRNPWRFSFDAITGDMWIADVGQNEFEEIDLAPADESGRNAGAGLNFGWSAFEANEPFNAAQPTDRHVPPVLAYPHSNGDCSVSGGTVARDSTVPDLDGWYVYGDFCSGRIWALDTTSVGMEVGPAGVGTLVGDPINVEIGGLPQLVAVEAGPGGDLYVLSLSGSIFRIIPA